jgi:hypothetical protein
MSENIIDGMTKIIQLDVDLIDENEWNPNLMSDAKFNKLTEEIETMGMMDPIQVVPLENGRYRILGGAHRFNACLILGFEKIPAIILDDPKFQDLDYQKLLTTRLNLIHGKMTRDKFSALYEDLAKRHSDEVIRDSMALIDKNEWDQMKKELLINMKELLPPGSPLLDNFEDTVKELRTLDDMTKLLESIFHKKEKGEKFNKILAFGTGGGKVVYFSIDDEIWGALQKLKSIADTTDIKMDEILDKAM